MVDRDRSTFTGGLFTRWLIVVGRGGGSESIITVGWLNTGLLVDGYRPSNTPVALSPACKLFTTLRCTINRESQWLVTG